MKNIKFLLPLFALIAFTFFQCSKETTEPVPSTIESPAIQDGVSDRDDEGDGTSNFAITYKLDGQNTTEQVFSSLPTSAYKHAVVSPALSTEPSDLVHVEAVAFNTRSAYEAWGQSRGYKIRESLNVDEKLNAMATNAGLTDVSSVPQWYNDYANNVANQQLDIPSPCYIGVTLWDRLTAPPIPIIEIPTYKPCPPLFHNLTLFYHRASSAKFHRLTYCGTTTAHMTAFSGLFGINKIMSISVVAGTPRFKFVNIFAPLNNNIGSFSHYGTVQI
jgi:hypothetical protein